MPHNNDQAYEVGEKSAWLGIVTNVLLFAIKFFAGIVGTSQAMIADAVHTASDALTSAAVLAGFKIARKPADKHHPFGHGRAESIAAKIVSLVLIFVGLKIAGDSAGILISGQLTKPGSITFVAAIISIAVKELTYRQVISASKRIKSTSLKADAQHHRSDALSSIAALVGITGARLGHAFMDPLAGIIVAGFIIKMGVETFHAAYDELMDAAPPPELPRRIESVTLRTEGVEEVKKIMVRKTGIEFFIEVTIGVGGTRTVNESHMFTMKIKRDIVKVMPNVKDVIVHVEPV